MTAEIGTGPPPATDRAALMRQALFEAIRNGEAGVPLLRTLLGDTKLAPEQQEFVDLLIELEERQKPTEAPSPPSHDGEAATLDRELADLREANDTVAAALGACPYCWGGNQRCTVCRGRGRAGYTEPDPALFNELVLPAIRRVRAVNRGTRPRSRGLRG